MDVFNNAPNNKKGGKHQTFQYQDISFRTLRCFLLFIYTLHLAFRVDVDQKKSNFLQNKSNRPWGCFPYRNPYMTYEPVARKMFLQGLL